VHTSHGRDLTDFRIKIIANTRNVFQVLALRDHGLHTTTEFAHRARCIAVRTYPERVSALDFKEFSDLREHSRDVCIVDRHDSSDG
jgi:hypothetical protein